MAITLQPEMSPALRASINAEFRRIVLTTDSPLLAIVRDDDEMWGRCFPYDERARKVWAAAHK